LDSTAVDKRDWTLADVRGTQVLADDGDTQQRATESLIAHSRGARRPIDQPPLDSDGLVKLGGSNDGTHCHRKNLPARHWQENDRVLERGTGTLCFFVPTAVLSDNFVVANHRPVDVNDENPLRSATLRE
jgi:hypothetical protein